MKKKREFIYKVIVDGKEIKVTTCRTDKDLVLKEIEGFMTIEKNIEDALKKVITNEK